MRMIIGLYYIAAAMAADGFAALLLEITAGLLLVAALLHKFM